MSHPFAIVESEDDLQIDDFIAFAASTPGTLGGIGLGASIDDLAALGIPVERMENDELYLGEEELEEYPETPYHEEDPEWDKGVAQELFVYFEDGKVNALRYVLRGHTPTDECFYPEPPSGNKKLPAIREGIIAALREQFEDHVGKKRVRFLDGDLVVECSPMERGTIYEPWDLLTFELEIKENTYTEEELTLRPFTGSDEELETIRNAIDCPDSFETYRPIIRVECEEDEEEGGLIFHAYYIDEDEEENYAVLQWDAPDEILSPTYGANMDFTLAFMQALTQEFADDDVFSDEDDW